MKGILLAGVQGSRLWPTTNAVSKHLLPIYDKPLIFYPLSVLMLAGIRDILIISDEVNLPLYQRHFDDGSNLGIKISYKIQEKPNGIAESLIIGEDFIDNESVALILGDNIFFGHYFGSILLETIENFSDGAHVFAYHVKDPRRFGVIEFDEENNILNINEKPKNPQSNYIIPGLYFYDSDATKIAKNLTPSKRGELEITDLNLEYLKRKKLKCTKLWRGFAWLDTGTPDSMLEASHYVQTIERAQGYKIACLEEIAFNNKWISKSELIDLIKSYPNNALEEYFSFLNKND